MVLACAVVPRGAGFRMRCWARAVGAEVRRQHLTGFGVDTPSMRILFASAFVLVNVMAADPVGIGVSIVNRTAAKEPLRVNRVFEGSGAAKAGMKADCWLISIDGTNVVAAPIREVAAALRGVVGSEVIVGVADPKRAVTNEFRIKRSVIRLADFQ